MATEEVDIQKDQISSTVTHHENVELAEEANARAEKMKNRLKEAQNAMDGKDESLAKQIVEKDQQLDEKVALSTDLVVKEQQPVANKERLYDTDHDHVGNYFEKEMEKYMQK